MELLTDGRHDDEPSRHIFVVACERDFRFRRLIESFQKFSFTEEFGVVHLPIISHFDGAFIAQDKFFDAFLLNRCLLGFDFEVMLPFEDATQPFRQFWGNRFDLGISWFFLIATPNQSGSHLQFIPGGSCRHAAGKEETQAEPGKEESAHWLKFITERRREAPVGQRACHPDLAEHLHPLRHDPKESRQRSSSAQANKR